MSTVDINVHHVTRVEGHGNIVVNAKDGTIQKVEWQVPEAPRFFEAMVRGRDYKDLQTITSRICGICSISHSFAGIKAIEAAMDIEVSEQTNKLRLLTHCSEQLQSHSLHVGYLVAPDLLGVKSVVPLVATHPEAVLTIIRTHRVANRMSDILAGRTTHPITLVPGGFKQIPTEAQLRELKDTLIASVDDLKTIASVVLSVADKLPDFTRETEYVALKEPGVYTFYHGDIASTDTDETAPVSEFERVANEYMVPQSTAKWTKWHRKSYSVGALARFNVNSEHLHPLAKSVAEMFGMKAPCYNPFMCNVAQIVEAVHEVEESIILIDDLLTKGLKQEKVNVTPKAGNGAGAVEAPRGLLMHRYWFDKNGICEGANITVPTHENHGNIQADFEEFVPKFIDRPQEELTLLMEMLVRAYDPCISCSCHFLNVEFV